MDATSSIITIVSSVWTLTVHCKRLVDGVRNSEERLQELESKAKSFSTVIGHVRTLYETDGTSADLATLSPREQEIRVSIKKTLEQCREDFEQFQKVVLKLRKERKERVPIIGVALNKWQEDVVAPVISKLEKAITQHQNTLQSLIGIGQGFKIDETMFKMDETRKDLNQFMTAILQLFAAIEPTQGLNIPGRAGQLQRVDSDAMTLVPSMDETDGDNLNALEDGAPNPLEMRAQAFLMAKALTQVIAIQKSPKLSSGDFDGPSSPTPYKHHTSPPKARKSPSPAHISQFSVPRKPSKQERKVSFNDDGLLDLTTRSGSVSRSSDGLTLVPTVSSNAVESDGDDEDGIKEEAPGGREILMRSPSSIQRGIELIEAVNDNDMAAFNKLLDRDTSLEERDDKLKTPLIVAASLGRVNMLTILLANRANATAVDKNKATALHCAVESSSWPAVSTLVNYFNTNQGGRSPRDRGIPEINLCNRDGRTPLHCCTSIGSAEGDMLKVAKELIAYEADINARDNFKVPPVYYAIERRRTSVVKLFLDKGADLEFEHPETTGDIRRLLRNHQALKKEVSPRSSLSGNLVSEGPKRKRSRFSLPRRQSEAKT